MIGLTFPNHTSQTMLARTSRNGALVAKRFQHAAAKTEQSTFSNKYNFDLAPPQTHQYWNVKNSILAFGIGYGVFLTSDWVYGSYFAATTKEYSLRKPLK